MQRLRKSEKINESEVIKMTTTEQRMAWNLVRKYRLVDEQTGLDHWKNNTPLAILVLYKTLTKQQFVPA